MSLGKADSRGVEGRDAVCLRPGGRDGRRAPLRKRSYELELALTRQSLERGVADRGSSVCGGEALSREKGGESPGGRKGLVLGVLKEPHSRECLGAPQREPRGLRTSGPLGDLPTTLGLCALVAKASRISKIQS